MTLQIRGDQAIKLEAQVEEIGAFPCGQHLQLQRKLTSLGFKDSGESGVDDRCDADRGQSGAYHIGEVLDVSIYEIRFLSGGYEKLLAGLFDIDRGDIDQEAKALADGGELAVDRQVGGRQRCHRNSWRLDRASSSDRTPGMVPASASRRRPR